MLMLKLLDFFAIFGFTMFMIICMVVVAAITSGISRRKRKFRRKW